MTGNDVRDRLREGIRARGLTQQQLCERLTERTGERWLIQRLSKILTGRNELKIDDFVAMADAAGVSMVELVREPGREFVADLTPSELLVLHAIRDTPQLQPAILQLLGPTLKQLPGASRHAIIKARMARQTKGGDD